MNVTVTCSHSPEDAIRTLLCGGGERHFIPVSSFDPDGTPLWDGIDFGFLNAAGEHTVCAALEENRRFVWLVVRTPDGADRSAETAAALRLLPPLSALLLGGSGLKRLDFLEEFPTLAELALYDIHVRGPLVLGAMRNLRRFHLHSSSAASIEGIVLLSSLVTLRLQDNDLAALPALGAMPSLRELICIDDPDFRAGISLTGIARLRHLSDLRRLRLLDLPMLADLSPVKGLTTLTELELCCHSVTDFSPLAALENLRKLRVWTTAADAPSLADALSRCPHLAELSVGVFGDDPGDVHAVRQCLARRTQLREAEVRRVVSRYRSF